MLKLYVMLKTFRDDRKGATAIEYGLIAAAMATVLIAAMAAFSPALTATFARISGALN